MKSIAISKSDEITFVDDDDFEHLSRLKWHISKGFHTNYARTTINGKKVRMHRLIMGIQDPKIFIDHIDGNGLNNQKENLRICNNSQNQANSKSCIKKTSKYKGVSWNKSKKKWIAQICHNRKKIHIGNFNSEIDALIAYNKKAKELFGDYAYYHEVQL